MAHCKQPEKPVQLVAIADAWRFLHLLELGFELPVFFGPFLFEIPVHLQPCLLDTTADHACVVLSSFVLQIFLGWIAIDMGSNLTFFELHLVLGQCASLV